MADDSSHPSGSGAGEAPVPAAGASAADTSSASTTAAPALSGTGAATAARAGASKDATEPAGDGDGDASSTATDTKATTSPSSRGGSAEDPYSELREPGVKEWIAQKVAAEETRVRGMGTKIISVPVKNMSMVRESGPTVMRNRIECDTAFGFQNVHQLLVSDPVPCPVKPGFAYVNVVLIPKPREGTDLVPPALLVPYLFDTRVEGAALTDWAFVNKRLETVKHHVEAMYEVGGSGERVTPSTQPKTSRSDRRALRRAKGRAHGAGDGGRGVAKDLAAPAGADSGALAKVDE